MLVAFGAGIWGLRRCAPPPPNEFSKPGNDGGRIPAKVDRETSVTIDPRGNSFADPGLSKLACGTPYKFYSTASESVNNCEGYNFSRLLERADGALNNRLIRIECEEPCGPKQARVTYAKYECRGHRAAVYEKSEFLCPRPGTTAPVGSVYISRLPVNQSTVSAVGGDDGNMDQPNRRSEVVTDVAISTAGTAFSCPETTVFNFRYAEKEPFQCASFSDYRPTVDRAEERATVLYYDRAQCQGACVKQPLRFLRREWSCDPASSDVVVKLWFAVECAREGEKKSGLYRRKAALLR